MLREKKEKNRNETEVRMSEDHWACLITLVFTGAIFNKLFSVPGIFAYLNYLTPKTRQEILELLVNGLKRLEYRGYDSAGWYIFKIYS